MGAAQPPHWIPDENTTECVKCHKPFSVIHRRHHCRRCGDSFCGDCTNWRANFMIVGYDTKEKPQRVCYPCHEAVDKARKAEQDRIGRRSVNVTLSLHVTPAEPQARNIRSQHTAPPSISTPKSGSSVTERSKPFSSPNISSAPTTPSGASGSSVAERSKQFSSPSASHISSAPTTQKGSSVADRSKQFSSPSAPSVYGGGGGGGNGSVSDRAKQFSSPSTTTTTSTGRSGSVPPPRVTPASTSSYSPKPSPAGRANTTTTTTTTSNYNSPSSNYNNSGAGRSNVANLTRNYSSPSSMTTQPSTPSPSPAGRGNNFVKSPPASPSTNNNPFRSPAPSPAPVAKPPPSSNAKPSGGNCHKCRKALDGNISSIDGMSFHRNCFACKTCGVKLFDQICHVLGGNTFCDRCGRGEQLNEMPSCEECRRPLSGDCMKVNGKGYHVSCHKCFQCRKVIGSGSYFPKNGKSVCPSCK